MRYDIDLLQTMGVNIAYVEVCLDGEKLVAPRCAIAFDPVEGWVEVYRKNTEGHAIVENDKYVVDTLRGKVEGWLLFGERLNRDTREREKYWPHALPQPANAERVLISSIR
jgi:hypothetical protein